MTIRSTLMTVALTATATLGTLSAEETVKVGVLHSLSGTMAISETSCKDATVLAVEEINAKGGVLGKKIEAVVVDPASNWPLFAEKAKELLLTHKVSAVFGCWTSVSRKSVLPVFEENNGLLFYPVQYEGEEQSLNVFYTAASPNQQLVPAAEYMLEQGVKKFYLLGTDYVFPRTANKVLKAMLKAKGIPDANVKELRRLKLQEKIDFFCGITSSGNTPALGPVAEELKVLTIFVDGCTDFLFDKAVPNPHYIFRVTNMQSADGVTCALAVAQTWPKVRRIAHIHPDYAYGRNAFDHFTIVMKKLMPHTEVVYQGWPKLGTTDFTSHITAAVAAKPDLLVSSVWGGDYVAFYKQALRYGVFGKMRFASTIAFGVAPHARSQHLVTDRPL